VKKGQNGRKSLRRLKPQWVVTTVKEIEKIVTKDTQTLY
jgi:hypothetical protein